MNWNETTPLSAANLNGLEVRISNATISVTNGKETIANAITAMDVPSTVDDSFAEMAAKIQAIDQGVWHESGSVNITSGGTATIIPENYHAGVFIVRQGTTSNFIALDVHTIRNAAESSPSLTWEPLSVSEGSVSLLSTGYSGVLNWEAWGY